MAASAASEDSRTHIRNAADDINLQTVKDGAGINDPVTFSTRRHVSAKEWHIIIVKTKLDIWQVKATRQRNKWSTHDQKFQFCQLVIS